MSEISAKTKICMIVGDPVSHSLSPAMHNAGYAALGRDAEFVFIASRVKKGALEQVLEAFRAMEFQGLACTIPHKEDIIPYLDTIDPVAKNIGAVNTVVNSRGVVSGFNTDWMGIVNPIEARQPLLEKSVAILGAGGTSRAAAFGCLERGAKVTIFNRSEERGKELSKELGVDFYSLNDIAKIYDFDVVINTTSVGMASEASLIPKDLLHSNQLVLDAVYTPYETRLIREAAEQGASVIRGAEMFLFQGLAQFSLHTSLDAPREAMEKIVLEHFGVSSL